MSDRFLFNEEVTERMSGKLTIANCPEEPQMSELKPESNYPIPRPTQQYGPANNESHLLARVGNDLQNAFSKDKCLHELFEEQAARTPENTALIFGERRLTYRELNRRANQLAHYLRSLGVEPEMRLGLCVERSDEMIVGLLGILKAGGAYVPLDPNYPHERLAFILEDSQVALLLTRQDRIVDFDGHESKIVAIDADAHRIAQKSDSNLTSITTPGNLAYVIYTSGSSGTPKGVAIEHRSTVALLDWATSVFTLDRLQGVLASTSICFDVSVFEIFAPLCCGGAVILAQSVLHLSGLPAANEVTLISTVPSMVPELLRSKCIPSSARTINLAGEPLKTSLVKHLYALNTVKEVFDLYGPTEDTTYSTFTLRNTDRATIGRPISNTQVYILDRDGHLVPTGVVGELCLGGAGLARGYLNRPELTAEHFVANPFSNEPNARIYKTGDLARYLPTGELEYFGRLDDQVKIRGCRVELGEIEVALSRHPAIGDCVVIVREDQPDDKRLVAYLVAAKSSKTTSAELRDFLKQKLPSSMVPSAFVTLEKIPLTLSGKIDKRALPAPSLSRSWEEEEEVGCRDEIELKLINIWKEILLVTPITVEENFFDLGGDSLQAVRMFAEVEKTFRKSIPLASLFHAETIAKLAAIIRQEGWSAPESSIVPIQLKGTKPPFFCVHARGGSVLFYRDLARFLGNDRPFYGIQPRRLGGRQVAHETIQEMAEYYIEEIQILQPHGPYYLGGASFGGLVAFEMAQQLHATGRQVNLVALLDAETPNYSRLSPDVNLLQSKADGASRRVRFHWDRLVWLNSGARAEYILDRLRRIRRKLRRRTIFNYRRTVGKLHTMLHRPLPPKYIQVENHIEEAMARYLPQFYPGKLTLLRASRQPFRIDPDPTLGWADLAAGGLTIHEVPGDHVSILMEPNVRILAERLKLCLEGASTPEQAIEVQAKSLSEPINDAASQSEDDPIPLSLGRTAVQQ